MEKPEEPSVDLASDDLIAKVHMIPGWTWQYGVAFALVTRRERCMPCVRLVTPEGVSLAMPLETAVRLGEQLLAMHTQFQAEVQAANGQPLEVVAVQERVMAAAVMTDPAEAASVHRASRIVRVPSPEPIQVTMFDETELAEQNAATRTGPFTR